MNEHSPAQESTSGKTESVHNANFWSPELIYPENTVPEVLFRRIITRMMSSGESFCSVSEAERQNMLIGPTLFALSKMKKPLFYNISVVYVDNGYPELYMKSNFTKKDNFIFPFNLFDWIKLYNASGKIEIFCAKIDVDDAILFCKWLPIIYYDVIEDIYQRYQLIKNNKHVMSSLEMDKMLQIEIVHGCMDKDALWGTQISEIIIHCINHPDESTKINYKAPMDEKSTPESDVEVDILSSTVKWVSNANISKTMIDIYDIEQLFSGSPNLDLDY